MVFMVPLWPMLIFSETLTASREYLEAGTALLLNIDVEIKEDQMADFQKLDAYKMHVKNDMELLSDMALNKLVSGETVEVVDEAGDKYEPLFSVKFKKS